MSGVRKPRKPAAAAVEFRAGRRPKETYTDVHDWVALSGASPQAIALYQIYCIHVNRERALDGDTDVWPTRHPLAKMLSFSRPESVDPYNAELEALGAITITLAEEMPARNIYTVHMTPPEGYEGPVNLKQWYEMHDDELTARRAAAAARTERSRAKARAVDATAESATKPQLTLVTASSALQAPDPSVTRSSALQVTGSSALHVTRSTALELELKELELKEPSSPPSSSPGGADVPGQRQQKKEITDPEQQAFIDEVRRHAPHWSPSTIVEALAGVAAAGEHPPNIARAALLLIARGRYPAPRAGIRSNASPKRLAGQGPWWQDAYAFAARPTPAALQPEPGRAAPQQRSRRQCTTGGCVDGLLDVGGVTLACPVCKPGTHLRDLDKARADGYDVHTLEDLIKVVRAA